MCLQEQLRKSLLARIADKLEEGGQHPSPTRMASALSPSQSKAQLQDTIPGLSHIFGFVPSDSVELQTIACYSHVCLDAF